MEGLWERRVAPTLRDLPFWYDLPPWAHRPEVVVGVAVAVGVAAWILWRLAFGSAGVRRPGVSLARAERADLRAMRRAGNWRGIGAQHEQAGRWRKALAAYAKGGHPAERARLLERRGDGARALEVARNAGLWALAGELATAQGEFAEAAVAYERAGEPFLAARAWDEAGDIQAAGRAYLVAGAEGEALSRLLTASSPDAPSGPMPDAASWVDRAIRASLESGGLGVGSRGAVLRGIQLWLAEGAPERALRLAVDADRADLAVPIVRDHLEPSVEGAALCERVGAHAEAADLWRRLGDTRREAIARARVHRERGDLTEAARWLERADAPLEAAEAWIEAGDLRRAADLYAAAGDGDRAEALRRSARERQR